jgi:hypothetical protein
MTVLQAVRSVAVVALLSALVAGCSSVRVEQSPAPISWAGNGVTLTLPPGTWRIEPLKNDAGTLFSADDGARVVLLRVESKKPVPDGVALRRLFVQFDAKKEVRRWELTLPCGTASCADYDVDMGGRTVRVRACILSRGPCKYEFAGWNLPNDSVMDSILASVKFIGAAGGTP